MKTIKRGAEVRWSSKTHKGRGKVVKTYAGKTGSWVTVKTAHHPAGEVTVRESQVRAV